jgi:hypothetical protein
MFLRGADQRKKAEEVKRKSLMTCGLSSFAMREKFSISPIMGKKK